MEQAALEIRDLTKAFGGLLAVDHVFLRVPTGRRHALIGPNGAGKTTLFNCIAGTLAPTSGRVTLFGQDVTRLAEPRRASLGLARTYQITNLFPGLTTLENVLMAVQGTTRQKWVFHRPVDRFHESLDRAAAELERVGLGHRAGEPVHRLSYGERRQLEFALALACRPRALLLDEPTAGLSPADRNRISKTIAQVPRDITVLLIEHNMDVVLELADRITVLHNGRVVVEGPPDEVRANPQAREVYLGAA